MIEINQLLKFGDILNSEGTILGLYKKKSGDLFLSSYLKDGSGEIFYATDRETLKKYFDCVIKLKEVYLNSNDFIVTRKFRNETTSFIKLDFVNMIQCGDNLFLENSKSMRNDKLVKDIYSNNVF